MPPIVNASDSVAVKGGAKRCHWSVAAKGKYPFSEERLEVSARLHDDVAAVLLLCLRR